MAPSPDFPFNPNFIEVNGSNIHYVDEGEGDPILFLHGNPTSSYLWRNIIPHMVSQGRCIAPDLIGMGKSDKPEIAYRFFDHVNYIEAFIEKLNLKNITLVIHDWGSALGFHYAMRNQRNIKGIAFMEALIKPAEWKDFPSGFKIGFKLFRTPFVGWVMISCLNMFVKQILPQAIVRQLSTAEKLFYAAPYKTIRSRKPLRIWPCEIPINRKPYDVYQVMDNYKQKLMVSDIPKLLFYASPGGIIDAKMVNWCRQHLKNLKTIDIGKGIHYLQEDNPQLIGSELARWYKELPD